MVVMVILIFSFMILFVIYCIKAIISLFFDSDYKYEIDMKAIHKHLYKELIISREKQMVSREKQIINKDNNY
jgi:hypothetical protein